MHGPCRIGVQLPEVERVVPWPEYASIARAAEAAGFDSIWVGDHHLYREDGRPERAPWEAWTMLAALASITERVQLGPLVACLNFAEPGVLARAAATVDEQSGGRLVLGVGSGWNEPEFDAFGIPFDHRVARFEESFEILRRLLDGERVTVAGRWHRVDDAVLLPRPPRRPPLMIGSNGERMLAATLPHVDAWNTWFDDYGNTPEGFAALRTRIDAGVRRGRPRSGDARAERLRAGPARGRGRGTAGRARPAAGRGTVGGRRRPGARGRRRGRGHLRLRSDHRGSVRELAAALEPLAT